MADLSSQRAVTQEGHEEVGRVICPGRERELASANC